MKYIYPILLLFLFSCSNKTNRNNKANFSEKLNAEKKITQKIPMSEKELKVLSKLEAINKYGLPFSEERFVLDDAQGEFRITLNNFYSREQRQKESILIDELTWEKNENNWITVWYEVKEDQSMPREVYSWEKGSEF